MVVERTFAMIKPDGVARGLVGEILRRYEARGLTIVGMKLLRVTPELAAEHYAEHQGKPFYQGLVDFITSGPAVALALEGENAVALVRAMNGATNPADAAPGTIRGDLALEIGRNVVHGSDAPATAERELAIYFDKGDYAEWSRPDAGWLKE